MLDMAQPRPERMEFLQGTLEMVILKTLLFGPKHGYGIAQFIRQTSNDVLLAEAGSLYPAAAGPDRVSRLPPRARHWMSGE